MKFVELVALNDASSFGSGKWSLDADVAGSKLNLLSGAEVDDDLVIAFGGHSVTVTIPPGADLTVSVSGLDEAGLDDELGTTRDVFGPAQTPQFGLGRHVAETDYFRITYDIALAP